MLIQTWSHWSRPISKVQTQYTEMLTRTQMSKALFYHKRSCISKPNTVYICIIQQWYVSTSTSATREIQHLLYPCMPCVYCPHCKHCWQMSVCWDSCMDYTAQKQWRQGKKDQQLSLNSGPMYALLPSFSHANHRSRLRSFVSHRPFSSLCQASFFIDDCSHGLHRNGCLVLTTLWHTSRLLCTYVKKEYKLVTIKVIVLKAFTLLIDKAIDLS